MPNGGLLIIETEKRPQLGFKKQKKNTRNVRSPVRTVMLELATPEFGQDENNAVEKFLSNRFFHDPRTSAKGTGDSTIHGSME